MEPLDFDAWYRTERPRLFRAVWAVAGDRDVAAETVDEAFSRAFERWDGVGVMESPAAWVRVVALNLLRRTMRRKGIEARLFGRHRAVSETSDALPDPQLWEAVGALPERQRQVIALRYVLDCSEAETARVLGISEGATSATLTRARRRLAEVLQVADGEVALS